MDNTTSEHKQSVLIVSDGRFLEDYLVEQLKHDNDVRLLHTDDLIHVKALQRHYDTVIYCPVEADNIKYVNVLCQAMDDKRPDSVVLISSYEVYGSCGSPATETSRPEPSSTYGQDMLACEEALTEWTSHRTINLAVLRTGEIIGNNMIGRIRRMADRISNGTYLHIPGYDDGTISLIHAEDLAAIVDIIRGNNVVLNINDGCTHHYKDTADAIAHRLNDKRILTMPRKLVWLVKLLSHIIPSVADMLKTRSSTVEYSNDAMITALHGRCKTRNVTEYLLHIDEYKQTKS